MQGWHFTSIYVILSLLLSSSSCWSSTFTSLDIQPISPEKGWVIVEKRLTKGYPVTIGMIGRELDLSERESYRLFEGGMDYKTPLYPFKIPIAGFISAEFYEAESGKPFFVISYTSGDRPLTRIVRIKPRNFDALSHHLGSGKETLRVSLNLVEIVTTRDLDTISTRQKAEIVLKNQRLLSGRLLPVLEEGSIYMALRDGSTQRIDPMEVERLTIKRSIIGQVMGSTIGRGIEGALAGGAAGLFAGLSFDGFSGVEEMKIGAVLGGIAGLGFGFLDGVLTAEGSKTYEFRPSVAPDAFELLLTMGF